MQVSKWLLQTVVSKKNLNEHRPGIGSRQVIECALGGSHRSIRFESDADDGHDEIVSIEQFYESFGGFFQDTLDMLFYEDPLLVRQVKIQPKIHCLFKRIFLNDDGDIETKFIKVWISNEAMDAGKDPILFLEHNKLLFENKIEEYLASGSGWNLEKILSLDWTIVRFKRIQHYQGLGAASGSSKVRLPKELTATRSIINVDNKKQEDCFRWAILSVIHYNDVDPNHHGRQSLYDEWKDDLNFKDITFPVCICQIKIFERNNPGIAINVFKWREINNRRKTSMSQQQQQVLPIKILKQCSVHKARTREFMVNLLKVKNHYVGIVNLNSLLNGMTRHYGI